MVYGLHTRDDRKYLWSDLKPLVEGLPEPLLIMGDFNTILSSIDSLPSASVYELETSNFQEFIMETGLIEIKSAGRKYTWSNNHILSKLDWIFVNSQCLL